MAFNDAREALAMEFGEPVPAWQYVFHKYAETFYGNQCLVWEFVDCLRSSENLQFRLARAFCVCNSLSVTLRGDGKISWGATAPWDVESPDQKAAITIVKNLNAMRRANPDFLIDGEVTAEPFRLECGKYILHYRKKASAEYPSILTAAFKNGKGETMQFFVNFRNAPELCKIDGKSVEIPPLSAISMRTEAQDKLN